MFAQNRNALLTYGGESARDDILHEVLIEGFAGKPAPIEKCPGMAAMISEGSKLAEISPFCWARSITDWNAPRISAWMRF